MSDPYTHKLAELVRRLYFRTISGVVRWRQHDTWHDVYEADVGGRRVTIGIVHYESDDIPTQDVEVSIWNADGAKIESVRDSALSTIPLNVPGMSGWYAVMLYTYDSARRAVNGSESAVNELIEALDGELF